MKRTPLKRGSGLQRKPDKIREWANRTRTPLKRGKQKQRQPTPPSTVALIGLYSVGRCVICGVACNPRRDRHHVLPVQTWPEHELVAENQVLLCWPDHDAHERAARRLTLSELPPEVRAWVRLRAAENGPIEAYVARTYPPVPADEQEEA